MRVTRPYRSRMALLLAVMLALGIGSSAIGEINGEVIAAHNRRTANSATMSAAKGSGFTELSCGGDLTYQGVPRYFIRTWPGTLVMPDDYLNSIMTVADEDCILEAPLSGQPSNMRFSTTPHWSPDGSTIAVFAQTFDLEAGIQTASGIYLADVLTDGTGRPVGIGNLALEIELPGEGAFSWSGDGTRIVFAGEASSSQGGQQLDLFVHWVGTSITDNITQTDDTSELWPSWSPVDERIAFTRLVSVRGTYRYDIFTMSSAGGPATQVTRKGTTGQPQNINPSFSPDGQYLAFSSGDAWYKNDIYRIKADGSGKAVNLTSKQGGDYRVPRWRR